MTCRVEEGITYLQTYNAENRIASIARLAGGDCATPGNYATKWDFAYDGDGVRTNTLTTPYDENGLPQTAQLTAYYFGGAYETQSSGTIRKYYNFGGQTIVNEYKPSTQTWQLSYLLTDHLGSVVAVTDDTGTLTSQQRYLPFGGERQLSNYPTAKLTDYTYTGQRELDEGMGGLMDYRARFYSPYITHFSQPDTIVPDPLNPQAWNRYAYVLNNPIRYNDPTGHKDACSLFGVDCESDPPSNIIGPLLPPEVTPTYTLPEDSVMIGVEDLCFREMHPLDKRYSGFIPVYSGRNVIGYRRIIFEPIPNTLHWNPEAFGSTDLLKKGSEEAIGLAIEEGLRKVGFDKAATFVGLASWISTAIDATKIANEGFTYRAHGRVGEFILHYVEFPLPDMPSVDSTFSLPYIK